MLHVPEAAVDDFAQDVAWLWSNGVAVLEEPPTALQFLRDFVALSRPCIIRFAEPSMPRMNLDELVERMTEDAELNVDVSPDGHADAVRRVKLDCSCVETFQKEGLSVERMFVQPDVRRLTIRDFRRMLRRSRLKDEKNPRKEDMNNRVFATVPLNARVNSKESIEIEEPSGLDDDVDAIVYYSRQDDCLRSELPAFWSEGIFPTSFTWAEEAFGTGPPQAVNLWVGNENAVSSMHKDHYENLFYVSSGEKIFTLCPPADAPFLYDREFMSGRFTSDQQRWSVVPDIDSEGIVSKVRWIEADVTKKDDPEYVKQFPLLKYTHPCEIKVPAGCMLYLPSLWFHRVTQSCETVGVNYWYDMKFESPFWCYFHLLQQLQS